jgi:hypothetical protein
MISIILLDIAWIATAIISPGFSANGTHELAAFC